MTQIGPWHFVTPRRAPAKEPLWYGVERKAHRRMVANNNRKRGLRLTRPEIYLLRTDDELQPLRAKVRLKYCAVSFPGLGDDFEWLHAAEKKWLFSGENGELI